MVAHRPGSSADHADLSALAAEKTTTVAPLVFRRTAAVFAPACRRCRRRFAESQLLVLARRGADVRRPMRCWVAGGRNRSVASWQAFATGNLFAPGDGNRPHNRQSFARLRARKSLRLSSCNPFSENYFRGSQGCFSRQADTVGVTTRGSRAARHDKGRVRQPDRTFRVKDWLDRFWRNKPCELLVPTYLPHATNRQRTANERTRTLSGSPARRKVSSCSVERARFDSLAETRSMGVPRPAVPLLKETLLDEMEHVFWSARSQRRPLRPKPPRGAVGTHAWPE